MLGARRAARGLAESSRAHSAELQLLQGAEGVSVEQLLEARYYIKAWRKPL